MSKILEMQRNKEPNMNSVLIIEDDEFVMNMLKQTFERAGYEVGTASNGRIGLQLYQCKPFDVVITDLIMPDMEGIETISKLRKDDPTVKVIAISGGGRNSPDDYLHLAKKLGADRTFSKPVDRNELLAAVKDLVE
ncbi:MAG: response regulator [Desulfobacteraceae bacterium]|jgi:YesN/AraC family two-component response regulator